MAQVHSDRIGRPITVGALRAVLADWPDDALVVARGGRPSSIVITHPGPMPAPGSARPSLAEAMHVGPGSAAGKEPIVGGGSLLGVAGPPPEVRAGQFGDDQIDCPEDCGAVFTADDADGLAEHLRDRHTVVA